MPAMNPGTSPRAVSRTSLTSSGRPPALASRSDAGRAHSRCSRCAGSVSLDDARIKNPLSPAMAKGVVGAGGGGVGGGGASSSVRPMWCSDLALAVGEERAGLPMSDRGGPLSPAEEAPPASSGSSLFEPPNRKGWLDDRGVGILLG